MFVVVCCVERELSYVGNYDTLKEAQLAMLTDMQKWFVNQEDKYYEDDIVDIKLSVQCDKAIFFEDDGDIGVYETSAWWNGRGNNYDWKIFDITKEDGEIIQELDNDNNIKKKG